MKYVYGKARPRISRRAAPIIIRSVGQEFPAWGTSGTTDGLGDGEVDAVGCAQVQSVSSVQEALRQLPLVFPEVIKQTKPLGHCELVVHVSLHWTTGEALGLGDGVTEGDGLGLGVGTPLGDGDGVADGPGEAREIVNVSVHAGTGAPSAACGCDCGTVGATGPC